MTVAQILADARIQGRKLEAYPDGEPATEREAFAVQCEAAGLTGWTQTGWKIGCTSKMAKDMLRADGPFPGPIYAERTFANYGEVPLNNKAIRLVEPEIAFIMARNLPAGDAEHSVEKVISAVASVHLSLELVNRRLPGGLEDGNMWNIADGGCNDAFTLGPANEVLPAGEYAALELVVSKNGQPETVGLGINALGGPDIALTWLANYLNANGLALQAGEVVTTGVVTGLVYVAHGDEVTSSCAQCGEVSARYK